MYVWIGYPKYTHKELLKLCAVDKHPLICQYKIGMNPLNYITKDCYPKLSNIKYYEIIGHPKESKTDAVCRVLLH